MVIVYVIAFLVVGYVASKILHLLIIGELCDRCPKCGKLITALRVEYVPPPPHNWIEKYVYVRCGSCGDNLASTLTKTNIGIVRSRPK